MCVSGHRVSEFVLGWGGMCVHVSTQPHEHIVWGCVLASFPGVHLGMRLGVYRCIVLGGEVVCM